MYRSLWIDPAGNVLVKLSAFAKNGDLSHTANFSDYARVGEGLLLPQKIVLGQTASPRMTLRYTDLQQIGDDTVFTLPVPEGIKPVSLD